MLDFLTLLRENPYPGRGILVSRDLVYYFIMGRSANSRNRIFVKTEDGIRTEAHDPAKLEDPSLIIYHPVRTMGDALVVTNGDQTDTICQHGDFRKGLMTREYEPDEPNWTPRISAILNADGSFEMSILKHKNGRCLREFFCYEGCDENQGYFISTYQGDGNPLPTFAGEPLEVTVPKPEEVWAALNGDNKVSLYTNVNGEVRLFNKNLGDSGEGAEMNELELKYGCNPNQKPSKVFMPDGSDLPFTVLNGKPGYINLLDALNSWQLVKELKAATGLPAAASFKHVSPAGAAVGRPLSEVDRKIYFVDDAAELSPIACAYIRARGADRLCSYGDWAALSDVCDAATAQYLKGEVSDGIIAPGYTDEALEILKTKKKGGYNVVQINADYVPAAVEHKDVFGVTFEQGRNNLVIDREMLTNIVSENKELPEAAKIDMIVALITLKYTQSNSVCYVKDGQAIGVGAGQQSRIHCTRLAGQKADNWYLRQHPKVLGLQFVDNIRRPDRDNAIDIYTSDEYEDVLADGVWQNTFKVRPEVLTPEEKKAWIATQAGVTVGSDAFFPFGDNVERARKSGVTYIAEPGGSIRDDHVIATADKYGMVLAFTGARLFHH